MNPADFSIAEAGVRLRDGSLSSVELTQACLDRIAERDQTYHAFVSVDAKMALDAARAVDRQRGDGDITGPLHGIPMGVKDLLDTAGLRTAYGSRIFEDHVPQADAEVVRRVKAAGAIILGKLDTYDFGMVGPHSTGRFRPQPIRGGRTVLPAGRRPARQRPSRAAWCARQSAPTPAARSAARPPIAASSA